MHKSKKNRQHNGQKKKYKDYLALNQDNMSERNNMSTCVLLFQRASTINIQISVGPVQNRYHHHFTQNICSFPWYSWKTITHSPKRWIQNSALWMGISCIDLFLFIFQILLLCFAHNLRSDIKAQIAKWRYNRGALWSQERSYLIGYYF